MIRFTGTSDRRVRQMTSAGIALLAVVTIVATGCKNELEDSTPAAQPERGRSGAISTTAQRGPVTVTVSADPGAVTVGEKINLSVKVVAEQGVQVDMPAVESVLGAFAVRSRFTPPDVPDGDVRIWIHTYVLDTFANGAIEIPSLEVQYTDAREAILADHDEPISGVLVTEPIAVEIQSVLLGGEADDDFRDIRGAVDVPLERESSWLVFFVAAIAALVITIAVGVLLLLRRQSAGSAQAPATRPAHEIAHAELAELEREQLIEAGRYQEFFYRLSDIIRQYIERQYGLMAPERTTDEFLQEAGRDPRLTPGHRELLRQFLRAADMVKFARFAPAAHEANDALQSARGFVQETAPQRNAVSEGQPKVMEAAS